MISLPAQLNGTATLPQNRVINGLYHPSHLLMDLEVCTFADGTGKHVQVAFQLQTLPNGKQVYNANYPLIEISRNPLPLPQVLQIVKDATGWLLQNNDGSVKYAQMITRALPLNQDCNPAQWQLLSPTGELHVGGGRGAQHRLAQKITTRALFTHVEYSPGEVKNTYTDRLSTQINGVEKVFVLVGGYTFPHLHGTNVPGWGLGQCKWS